MEHSLWDNGEIAALNVQFKASVKLTVALVSH